MKPTLTTDALTEEINRRLAAEPLTRECRLEGPIGVLDQSDERGCNWTHRTSYRPIFRNPPADAMDVVGRIIRSVQDEYNCSD